MPCIVDDQKSTLVILFINEICQVPLHLVLSFFRLRTIGLATQISLFHLVMINIFKDVFEFGDLSYYEFRS